MRVIGGVNQDFFDIDEIDPDALEIVEEFYDGTVTFDELKSIVGTEAAQTILNRMNNEVDSIGNLFDNPEDY